ncbi:uncharacterized protein LOC122504138 [Leptopilina heterotoma]|uniref:uncharacterized protein LOC122504138 n=1 Tax=Leptopilina heterotoma TaxID=63436 RepID=UPI001CA9F35E|nr:uncharacterized protein LOC122504138 [Leptopilina heterotoma]
MKKRKRVIFIQVAAGLSILALVVVCLSLGTNEWITGSASVSNTSLDIQDSEINHGLFTGTLIRKPVSTPIFYDIYISCIWGSNKCAWSCRSNAKSREEEVESLLNGENPEFSCLSTGKNLMSSVSTRKSENDTRNSIVFVNAGAWLCTTILMILQLVAVTGMCALLILNSFKSPAETFLNIYGIYLVACLAIGLNLTSLIIYGCHYSFVTSYNIAIRDTITGEYTSSAYLGYSYWIQLLPLFLYGICIGLLLWRERIVNREPLGTKINIENAADSTLVLF